MKSTRRATPSHDMLLISARKRAQVPKIDYYNLFWIFFLCCFLGVVLETIWVYSTQGILQSRRGLIYGPFNCVYGFGAVLMTLAMYRLSHCRDAVIFLCGSVLGGIYEYLLSWGQEMILGTVSWQYDEMPFNLHGRINLLYTIFWGILALMWVKDIFPRIMHLISRIPSRINHPLVWVLSVFMVLNMLISMAAVLRMSERHYQIPAENRIERFLDRHYPDEYLKKVFPSMVYVE